MRRGLAANLALLARAMALARLAASRSRRAAALSSSSDLSSISGGRLEATSSSSAAVRRRASSFAASVICGPRDQAAREMCSARLCRRWAAKPKPAKPMIIIAQAGGSGTASEAISIAGSGERPVGGIGRRRSISARTNSPPKRCARSGAPAPPCIQYCRHPVPPSGSSPIRCSLCRCRTEWTLRLWRWTR